MQISPRAAGKENITAPLDRRDMLHRLIDALSVDSLPDVEYIIKQYVARDLNRRYKIDGIREERARRHTHKPATARPR